MVGTINKGEFANNVKSFGKNLFKAQKGFTELKETASSFSEAVGLLKKLEAAVAEKPVLAADFESIVREKQSLSSWKETVQLVEELTGFLESISLDVGDANHFIESFRNSRAYTFPNSKASASFFGELADLFSIKGFELKPQFIGTIDLNEVADELKLGKGTGSVLVEAGRLQELLKHLFEKRISRNLLFDSSKLRVFWHTPRMLRVAADSEKLKRLDLLCRACKGECVEKIGFQSTL